MTLECIGNLIKMEKQFTGFNNGNIVKASQQVEEQGLLDVIESLQNHENSQVYHTALSILETHFVEDEFPDEQYNNQVINNQPVQQQNDQVMFALGN